MKLRLILLVCCALFAGPGCSDDDPVNNESDNSSIRISGSLKFNKDITIPSNARLIVAWSVSADNPDYVYVYGEGSISIPESSFTISFDEAPPEIALNEGNLGVGTVLLMTKESYQQGAQILPGDGLRPNEILGTISGKALIYISGNPESVEFRDWARDFNSGFSIGKGVEQQSGFDTFTPDANNDLELTIDNDLSAFWFPNWT